MPIRFFCKRCNQMIQIGAQRAGQLVVCPQCGERLTVPAQSVAQAETLYQFLKQKRLAEKNSKKVDLQSLQKTTDSLLPVRERIQNQVPLQENRNAETDEEQNGSLEECDPEDMDRWIKEFWTTQPNENKTATENISASVPLQPTPIQSVAENRETTAITIRQHETWLLFRTWLFIVFLFGLVGGFGLCSFFTSIHKNITEIDGSAKPIPASENLVAGKLYYRGFDGERIPDADAVILLLPLDRIPTFPISGLGLRPDDNHLSPADDNVQQIKEIGGAFQRTGADGTFLIQYENKGHYLLLMISAHSKRSDPEPDSTTIRELKRFFRNPKELLGDYHFSREEYEFDQGKYLIRQTF
jgi:DNA-directed RNA polymerase subunit M/transcription elongation factor TFIIS